MSKKIQLRNLINLNEEAPMAPQDIASAPVPSPMAPPNGANAGGVPEQPTESPDVSPQPEDPSEYDFTKDFRAFEDKKNKAEADAKKVLLDKMNKRLLNKTIVANASRGYGQPKTDYTITNIKKISVEFWYKDYVVIVSDENDKKYFLTPGINIKINGEGSEPAPGSDESPAENPAGDVPQPGEQPAPQGQSGQPAEEPKEAPNATTPQQPAATPQEEPPQANPQAEPEQVPAEPDPKDSPFLKKKKKVAPAAAPVGESIKKDLNGFLTEFMAESVKNSSGRVNFANYIIIDNNLITESKGSTTIKYKLSIPETHLKRNVDVRDIRLAAVDTMKRNNYLGEQTKGSVSISKNGRFYLLEVTKETHSDDWEKGKKAGQFRVTKNPHREGTKEYTDWEAGNAGGLGGANN